MIHWFYLRVNSLLSSVVRGSGDENKVVATAKVLPLCEMKGKQKVSSVAKHFTERPLPAPIDDHHNGNADVNDYDDDDDNNNSVHFFVVVHIATLLFFIVN
jgi:hypothetical protein